MGFQHLAGAAYRALTAPKDGPSLYDVCDPVLLNPGRGDPHLCKFYRTALGNPALRPLLRRTGLAELREEGRLQRLRQALVAARDEEAPDWTAIGQPVAALLDTIDFSHPGPKPAPFPTRAVALAEIEGVIRACGAHLLRSFARCGFIPTYAAFNLIGDADIGGREFLMALTGLNSRGYKNSTLLFNLARIFIARSPARALINPPWRGIAEPMWEPMQIRHRRLFILGRHPGRLDRSDPQPAADRLLCRLPGRRRRQRVPGDGAAQRQHRLRRRRRQLDRQPRRRTALWKRSRSDAQSRHSRGQFPQFEPMEDHRDA